MTKLEEILRIMKEWEYAHITTIAYKNFNILENIATTIHFSDIKDEEINESKGKINIIKKNLGRDDLLNFDDFYSKLKEGYIHGMIPIRKEILNTPNNSQILDLKYPTFNFCYPTGNINNREILDADSKKFNYKNINDLIKYETKSYVFEKRSVNINTTFIEFHLPLKIIFNYKIENNKLKIIIESNYEKLSINILENDKIIIKESFNKNYNKELDLRELKDIEIEVISEIGVILRKKIFYYELVRKYNLIKNPLTSIFNMFEKTEEYDKYSNNINDIKIISSDGKQFEKKIYEILTIGGMPTIWLMNNDSIFDDKNRLIATIDLISYDQKESEIFVISCKSTYKDINELTNVIVSAEKIKERLDSNIFTITPCIFVKEVISQKDKDNAEKDGVLIFEKNDIKELYNTAKIRFLENKDFHKIQYKPKVILPTLNLKGEIYE